MLLLPRDAELRFRTRNRQHRAGQMLTLFQSTLPSRGATIVKTRLPPWYRQQVSIHAPLAGSDAGEHVSVEKFQLHAPLGEYCQGYRLKFQSTLPSRGATLIREHVRIVRTIGVSIHAPLAGSDGSPPAIQSSPRRFNPRSPRGERPASPGFALRKYDGRSPAGSDTLVRKLCSGFQSTLPSRGATSMRQVQSDAPLAGSDVKRAIMIVLIPKFQSTLPSRGATLHVPYVFSIHRGATSPRLSAKVSIHAPLAGSDSDQLAQWADYLHRCVSIHAPLAGSDMSSRRREVVSIHAPLTGSGSDELDEIRFNPRSPRGERRDHTTVGGCKVEPVFQSTLPSRGATQLHA